MENLILISAVSAIVGIVVFLIMDRLSFNYKLNSMKEEAETLLEQLDEKLIRTKVIIENNTILIYNQETDEFLAQASSWDELNEVLKARFPDRWFHLDQEDIERIKSFKVG